MFRICLYSTFCGKQAYYYTTADEPDISETDDLNHADNKTGVKMQNLKYKVEMQSVKQQIKKMHSNLKKTNHHQNLLK